MKEGSTFPKKAAYFCLAAPFIVSIAQGVAGNSTSASEISRNIMLFISLAILGCGFLLGVYSLLSVKKIKEILLPASIGIVFHLVIAGIAFSSFSQYQNSYQYFTISSQMNLADLSYVQIMFGRIHPGTPKDKLFDTLTSGLLATCPTCEILKTETHQSIPDHYAGIFENAPLEVSYVSIDTGNRTSGDIRFIFPEFEPQLNCQQLEAFVEQKRQMVGQNGVVSCVDAAK